MYVFLCAEAIKGKNGVTIQKEDFINKMGIPQKQVENGDALKKFLLPAIEDMKEKKILKNVEIQKVRAGEYKIKYEINKKQEDFFA